MMLADTAPGPPVTVAHLVPIPCCAGCPELGKTCLLIEGMLPRVQIAHGQVGEIDRVADPFDRKDSSQTHLGWQIDFEKHQLEAVAPIVLSGHKARVIPPLGFRLKVGCLVTREADRLAGRCLLKRNWRGVAENENGRHHPGGHDQQKRQHYQDEPTNHTSPLTRPPVLSARRVHDTTV
jgi:hypothetical protein